MENLDENVIILSDEAHRGDEGVSGINMRNAFKKAFSLDLQEHRLIKLIQIHLEIMKAKENVILIIILFNKRLTMEQQFL